jgi:O-antigen/teichoic acid export membrane protein
MAETTTATSVADTPPSASIGAGTVVLRGRLRAWAGIFSAYFGTQTIAQLLGIAAGLLFVRTMPVHEFALYTLATSVITFFAFATDLGSSSSLIHFYRQATSKGDDFRRYFVAVLSLRRVAFIIGVVVVAIALPLATHAKGFGSGEIALTTVAVIVAVGLQIIAALRQLALRLHGGFGRSYRADIAGAALRLALAVAIVLAAVLRSWLGILTAAAASAATAWLAREPHGGEAAASAAAIDLTPYRRAVLRYLLPTLPSALYFAVQGPLIVWLAATFGASRNIAEVGALTRLGLLVGIFSGLTGIVFLPRLARIHDDRLYRIRALQFGTVHLALGSGLLAAAWAVPGLFLTLLGSHYSGLHHELVLVVAGSGLTLLGGYAVSINLARCWTRWEVLAVAILATFQAIAVTMLPMGTTSGVLGFNVASAAVGLGLQLVVNVLGFWKPQWVQWKIPPVSPAG